MLPRDPRFSRQIVGIAHQTDQIPVTPMRSNPAFQTPSQSQITQVPRRN